MRRYTTPRLLIKVSGADLTGCDVYVTFRQGRREHTVKNPPMQVDGTDAYMEVRLTQMQSARFRHDRPVEVEANVVDFNGYRAATNIAETSFDRQLLEVPRHHG
jgi:hypothetical protein